MNQKDERHIHGKEYSGSIGEEEAEGHTPIHSNPNQRVLAHLSKLERQTKGTVTCCARGRYCGEQIREGGLGPASRSVMCQSGVGNLQRQDRAPGISLGIPPTTRPQSVLSHSALGLRQGACLKEAQLYLSGWKVHSQGRAAWDPQHQTSSSTQGRN